MQHKQDETEGVITEATVLEFLTENQDKQFTPRDLRSELGATDFDPENPLANPVHQALATLCDSGDVVEFPRDWGEPYFQVAPQENRYQEKREARLERLEERSERAHEQASSRFSTASSMADAIPFGQPIASNSFRNRDIRYRERMRGHYAKGVELENKAAHYEEKASAAENNQAVSSDDPTATSKLTAKLEDRKAHQEYMKLVNRAVRKAKIDSLPPKEVAPTLERVVREVVPNSEHADTLLRQLVENAKYSTYGFCFPPYELTNNNAQIKRLTARIAELEASKDQVTTEVDHGVCTVRENVEENRIQLEFDGKPDAATRDILKSNAFKWSRTNGVWQRHLNNAGRYAANQVLKSLGVDDTTADTSNVAESTPEPEQVTPDSVIRDVVSGTSEATAPEHQLAPFTLDDHKAFRKRANSGDLTAEIWKQEFERMLASKDEFVAGLQSNYNATQLKNLAGNLGSFRARQSTKLENANAIFRSLLQMFLITDSFSYSPMSESAEEAVSRQVRDITQENLDAYFEKQSEARAAHKKATSEPETLEEFRTFVHSRGEEELSDQQLATFDSLQADITRERRAKDKQSETVSQFQSDELDGFEFTITEGYHSKRDCKLWIVQLSSRVERATFNELKGKAKMLGGWYSSFVKSQAGFQFLDLDTANRFAGLLTGDADRSDVLEARRERRELTAAERLTRLAQELHERSEAEITGSHEAKQNTARRADIQAGVRGRAYSNQAIARTITRVAAALETGNAKYLDGVRHMTHVTLLKKLANQAQATRLRKLNKERQDAGTQIPYDQREAEREAPVTLQDIRHATYPVPTIYKRHLVDAVTQCSRARGATMASRRMGKRIKSEKKDYVTFSSTHDIEQLQDFLGRVKAVGHDTEWMDREVSDWKRLQAGNIYTVHELRSALRELVPLLDSPESDTPLQIAERELIGKKIPGFFPTPGSVVEQMLDLANIQPHSKVLEPSCGKGDIADRIREQHPDANLTVVEMNRTLGDILSSKGYDPVFGDFMQFGAGQSYDHIVMNPPFERGADMNHVQRAYELLSPGGTLVSIMGEGAFFRSDAQSTQFREWLDERGYSEKLPDDTFKGAEAFRETGVCTRLVVIEKYPS